MYVLWIIGDEIDLDDLSVIKHVDVVSMTEHHFRVPKRCLRARSKALFGTAF